MRGEYRWQSTNEALSQLRTAGGRNYLEAIACIRQCQYFRNNHRAIQIEEMENLGYESVQNLAGNEVDHKSFRHHNNYGMAFWFLAKI